MKKTDILITKPTNEILLRVIAEENKHLFPKDMQFAFDYIDKHPIVFPDSYLRSQKNKLRRKVFKLFQKQPNLSPKIVLITLLEPLPDFIPSDMLNTLCSHILDCWQQEFKNNKQVKKQEVT